MGKLHAKAPSLGIFFFIMSETPLNLPAYTQHAILIIIEIAVSHWKNQIYMWSHIELC